MAAADEQAWLPIRDDREWSDPDLVALRPDVVDPSYDRVDNIMGVHWLDPSSLRAHLLLYRQAMKGTRGVRKVDREMIALTVSTINECHY